MTILKYHQWLKTGDGQEASRGLSAMYSGITVNIAALNKALMDEYKRYVLSKKLDQKNG